MKITRHNYESFLIDFIDGTLDEGTKKELLLFLGNNPDIKNEFEEMAEISLSPGSLKMPGKQNLKKKDDSIPEFDQKCIACIENEMNPSEKKAFMEEISSDNEKSKIFRLYSATKLNPDRKIEFPAKDSLKKSSSDVSAFDEKCIAFLEDDMNNVQRNLFESELEANPESRKTFDVYSKIKLSKDTVEFPNKERLKKRPFILKKTLLYTSMSAAAGILLIAGFFALNTTPETGNGNVLAQSDVTFEDMSIKIQQSAPVNNNITEPVRKNENVVFNRKEKSPVHQPEFIAVQMPEELLKDDKEKKIENRKNEKQELNSTQDSTKSLIIPNEILLKQNDKKLADNSVNTSKNSKQEKDFLYYVEQGVNGLKTLTGSNVSMSREKGNDGKTKQFAFSIGKFGVSHTKAK